LSNGICAHICMYINAVASSVMFQLYLRHDFYNIISKIKHKLYITSGSSPPPPPNEKFWVCTCLTASRSAGCLSSSVTYSFTCPVRQAQPLATLPLVIGLKIFSLSKTPHGSKVNTTYLQNKYKLT
jgi:hypothetical protein